MFSAPTAWNHLHTGLHTGLQLDERIPIRTFKNVVKVELGLEVELIGICNHFLS